MRLERLQIASSLLLLASCVGMPQKPTITTHDIDYPSGEAIVRRKEPGKPSEPLGRVPLFKVDKAKCFLPEEWEKLMNYIDALEEAIKQVEEKGEAIP